MRFFTSLFLLIFLISGWANVPLASVEMDLFVSSTCPHCHKAEAFFNSKASEMPWLKINKYVINEDKAALELFYQRLKAINASDFTVPTLFFCGSRRVGFDTPEQAGAKLIQELQYCHEHGGKMQ